MSRLGNETHPHLTVSPFDLRAAFNRVALKVAEYKGIEAPNLSPMMSLPLKRDLSIICKLTASVCCVDVAWLIIRMSHT